MAQGFFDTVEGLQEVFWRNRTLQEFFTAYWLSQHASDEDAHGLWDWLYLPQKPLSEEYYWVWRFLVEMHEDAVDPNAWARSIEPLFRPGDGTGDGTKRSTEMIYRGWNTLGRLCDEGESLAREVRENFLGEFEHAISSGQRGEAQQRIAIEFRESFVEIPAGEFQMGAPAEKQGISEELRKQWRDFLDRGRRSRRASTSTR